MHVGIPPCCIRDECAAKETTHITLASKNEQKNQKPIFRSWKFKNNKFHTQGRAIPVFFSNPLLNLLFGYSPILNNYRELVTPE
jgi:hypothetical protein